MKSFLKKNYLVILITFILFSIPFFWIKPNEMDLGGDSSRLYFYDPLNFLINNSLYFSETITNGSRSFWPQFYFLPYVLFLLLIKSVINSPYFLISFINGIKVSISFLSVYLIIKIILQNSYKEKDKLLLSLPSIVAGLVYATSPIISENYDKALTTHDQIFLYPLCFYLILCYFTKDKFRYLLFFIFISFVFATNFTWSSAPPFFGFFPLTLLFIFIYIGFILKKKIRYTQLFVALLLLLGLHAFHFIPEAYSVLNPNSYVNQRVFSHSIIQDDLNYFTGVLPLSKLSLNILLYAPIKQFVFLSLIPALFIIIGFIFNKKKNKTYLLTSLFFLLTLYLVTANITKLGVKVYELFFYIPGFSMFRDFLGQWAFIFTFFYAILLGQAIYLFFSKINKRKVSIVITLIVSLSIVINSWSFFAGDVVNKILFQTNNVKIPMVMDPNYEQTLSYIRSLKEEGAFASFPFTDSYESVIHGLNNGAYEGLSPIQWLAGRLDYNGYIQYYPFADIFLQLVQNRDYTAIKQLLGILDVKYIYYNNDPKIYDTTFPGNPYSQFRKIFPETQKNYKPFIEKIVANKIYSRGTYQIFQTSSEYFNPEIYVPKYIHFYTSSLSNLYSPTEPFFTHNHTAGDVYIDQHLCKRLSLKACNKQKQLMIHNRPTITFEKINPIMYHVQVTNAKEGYMLVFSHSFQDSWMVSLTHDNIIQDIIMPNTLQTEHVLANGYANAWYILPKEVNNRTDYTLTIQLSDQKIFYISALISVVTLLIASIYGIFYFFKKRIV